MKFTCLTVYLHSANLSLYAELEASYYICLTQRHPLQIPLELYATVQNFMRVPNFYAKHLAPMQSIENSKHQHFPLLLSKLNGHSSSHCHAYPYNEKDNWLFKSARWTSSSFHVLCTYVSKFVSHSTNLKIFRTTRVTLYVHQISTNVRILCRALPCNKIYRANRSGSVSR